MLCAPSVVWAEAAPPEGSKPLTEILRPIELALTSPISKKSSLNRANTKSNISQKMDQSRRLKLIR
jgi:hypothetical protein